MARLAVCGSDNRQPGVFPGFFALLQGQDAILLLFLYALAFVSWKKQRLTAAGAWLGCAMFKFHLVLPFLLLILVQEKTAQASKRIVAGFLLVSVMLGRSLDRAVGTQQLICLSALRVRSREDYGHGRDHAVRHAEPAGRSLSDGVERSIENPYFDILVIFVSGVLYLVAAGIFALPGRDRDTDPSHADPSYADPSFADPSFADRSQADQRDLKFSLAVFATVLVSYHGLGYDLCVLALPALLLVGQLGKKIIAASWTGAAICAGLAVLLFSPLQLVLLMRYNRLALLGWALLLCFAGLDGSGPRGRIQITVPAQLKAGL
jgi:hypothetical protein